MTDKITADAMTRATQIATNAMKSKWRTKAASFQIFAPATTARRLATTSATIQKIVERAIAEVASWRGTNIKTSARRERHRNR
jgi:hypothetical protein